MEKSLITKLNEFCNSLHEHYSTVEPIFLTILKDKVIIKIGNSLPVETLLDKNLSNNTNE